jgi:hypothetical protein
VRRETPCVGRDDDDDDDDDRAVRATRAERRGAPRRAPERCPTSAARSRSARGALRRYYIHHEREQRAETLGIFIEPADAP